MADEETLTNDEDTNQDTEQADEEKSDLEKLKDAIEVAAEDVGTLRKKLTITIPRDAIDERLNNQYGELTRDAQVPGFRKGRAPRRLVEKRFGSEVNEQIVTQLVGNGFMAAVEKEELKVLGDPEVWVKATEKNEADETTETDRLVPVSEALDLIEIPDEGALTFACEIEVRPEFELPELKGIPIEKPKVEITDDDITKQLERVLASSGTYEPVEDDSILLDDLVIADLKITVDEAVLKEESNVQLPARPQQIEGAVLADLGMLMVGKKTGDTVAAKGNLPDDYEKPDFRGKEATFEFKIHDIKRLELPELSETFLKPLGFDSEAEIRDWVRQDLESRLEETLRRGLRSRIYEYLIESVKLDLPEGASSRQTDRALVRQMIDLYQQGIPEAEVEKHMDELKTGAREQALNELRIEFIMDRIAEELDVNVSEDEVNGTIAAIAQRQNRRFDRVRDDLAQRGALQSLAVQIRNDKIVDQLLADAEISETEPPKEEADEAPKKKKKTAAKKKTKSAAKKKAKDTKDADEE